MIKTTHPRLLLLLAGLALNSPANADGSGLMTAHDLVRVGCVVNTEDGLHETRSIPFLGEIRTYKVKGKSPCKVRLISQLSPSPDVDHGTWAGMHASLKSLIKDKGYQVEATDVGLGELGERYRFVREGEYVGFAYLIQQSPYALSVTVFSRQVEPGSAVEARIAETLSALRR